MGILSEKHAVKFFEKSLSSAFFAVWPCSCSRILVQSMVQVINTFFFLFASFADKLSRICCSSKSSGSTNQQMNFWIYNYFTYRSHGCLMAFHWHSCRSNCSSLYYWWIRTMEKEAKDKSVYVKRILVEFLQTLKQ